MCPKLLSLSLSSLGARKPTLPLTRSPIGQAPQPTLTPTLSLNLHSLSQSSGPGGPTYFLYHSESRMPGVPIYSPLTEFPGRGASTYSPSNTESRKPGASTYSPSPGRDAPTCSKSHTKSSRPRAGPNLLFWRFRGKYGGLDTVLET